MKCLKIFLFPVVLVLGLLMFAAPVSAQAVTTKVNLMIPFTDLSVENPCVGENVITSGNLHMLVSSTINNNIIRIKTLFQGAGFSGVGEITGDEYQAVGASTEFVVTTTFDGHFVTTFADNLRVVGPGPGNNFLLHSTVDMTIDADGNVIASVDNFWAECR